MMKFSKTELKDLFWAWIAISFAFAFLRFSFFVFNVNFLIYVFICLLTVGAGFLLHELGHKFVAQKYGCWAEFRAFYPMLWLAVLMSFFGFIFAAPGAVFIRNHVNLKRNGIISLAGPVVNMILAVLFYGIALLDIGFLNSLGTVGARINSWLAVFNMLPFMGLDGSKVLLWNKWVFAGVFLLSIVLMFVLG